MGVFGPELAAACDVKQLGFAFLGYLIFSVLMTIGAMEVNLRLIFIIMVVIDVLLIALTLNAFGVAPHTTHMIEPGQRWSLRCCRFTPVLLSC